MYVWIILRFRVAFGRELRAGAECCARTWQLWRRASWKQVGDVTEGLRECELSRLGRLMGCSLQSWRRGKRRRRLYFQLAITILLRSVVMEHQQKMSFVVGDLCDRTVTHETVDLNLVFFFVFFVCWCLSKESWVVYSLFLLNMVTCLCGRVLWWLTMVPLQFLGNST